jgi:hypothetical protein
VKLSCKLLLNKLLLCIFDFCKQSSSPRRALRQIIRIKIGRSKAATGDHNGRPQVLLQGEDARTEPDGHPGDKRTQRDTDQSGLRGNLWDRSPHPGGTRGVLSRFLKP